ncbi:serine/threonine protein kinase [Labilithrix luteola]|uniref:Serine/threonine protein kinase n=1 Tax=Labilithrix luteola TaxID=1391654 RepID=A0A0K1Q6S6_9BACT|nr:serine/threonine-protein kinase [Labilithrix luteola]AKV01438.1 serine/threonine protein kinase [Labilithrix luteola]
MLRIRLERYQALHDGLRWRSVTMVIGGGLATVVGTFGLVVGILLLVVPSDDAFPWRAGLVVGLFIGLFPFVAGIALVWRGIERRVRLGKFRELVAFGGSRTSFEAADLVATLQLSPRDAHLLVVDAVSHGLVFDDGGPSPPAAPSFRFQPETTPMLPLGRSVASGHAPTQLGGAAAASLPGPGAPPPAMRTAAAASPEAWIGTVLNDTYIVDTLLGTGGMGAVYAARNRRTGRRYAIKTLLHDARLEPDAIKRFEREATAASAIGHPNIIGVHDFNETRDGVHYMVMDLLDGETLEQRLSKVGAMSWREARARGLELTSALAAAHARGLLHRDLKPANVFLARSPDAAGRSVDRAVLLDFGLVKQMDDANVSRITATGAAVGTPMYMPPEQARGEQVDVRSDVYGLGAVLYEMVTGTPPFFDRTLASVYAKLLTTQAPPASSLSRRPLPPAFDHLLACALAKTPAERFATMPAFARALASIEPTESRAAG